MGIYLSVPVWFLLPEPYADLGRMGDSAVVEPERNPISREMDCADLVVVVVR